MEKTKMGKTKIINIIIALVVAIVLWSYVFGQVNPTAKTTLRNIPITILNEESLHNDGLTILSADNDSVNLTVSGQRNAISGISAKDFDVTADVTSLGEGEYRVRLSVVSPEDVTIESMSVQTVKYVIERVITELKPIEVVIINDESDETEPFIIQTSRSEVYVSGAKSLVNSVDHVQAELDTKKLSTEMQAYSIDLKAINHNGGVVRGLSLSSDTVSVTALILDKKTVNLTVPVIGEETEKFTRVLEAPKAITIKGQKSILDGIDSITCESIDISDMLESAPVTITPILPAGVEVAADSAELTAKVNVSGIKAETIKVAAENIIIEGLSDEYTASFNVKSVNLNVTAPVTVIDEIKDGDIKVIAVLSGLGEGEHEIRLALDTDLSFNILTIDPANVTVTISKASN